MNTSAIAQHAIQQHHIDWENAKIVDHQQKLQKRCYSESWQIGTINEHGYWFIASSV